MGNFPSNDRLRSLSPFGKPQYHIGPTADERPEYGRNMQLILLGMPACCGLVCLGELFSMPRFSRAGAVVGLATVLALSGCVLRETFMRWLMPPKR
jgi:hypothetical protein